VNLEPLIRQYGKTPAVHPPERRHNNIQHQLNGHFGLPVYEHLAVKNKSPRIERYPSGFGHSISKELHHHHHHR
jgi:hypothetical protein